MQLERPAIYRIVTQTSTYLFDTGAMRAYREPRPQPGAPGLVQRRLSTDGSPLVLTTVPDVDVGQPMRLLLTVPEEFLDRPAPQAGTPIVTTAVTRVSRLT